MSAAKIKGWAAIQKSVGGREWINPYTIRRTRSDAIKAYASSVGDEFASRMIDEKRVRFSRIVTEMAP